MTSLIVRRDIDFLLFDWLAIADVFDRSAIESLLDLSEKIAADHFLPHYKRADREEPQLTAEGVKICSDVIDALKVYGKLGLFSAGFPEKFGGQGFPAAACAASFAYFAAANIATSAYPMLTTANARLICKFGNDAQIEQFAIPQVAGQWFGTMCLSEPQAGSNLGDILTEAQKTISDDLGDVYRINGRKMWISGGDHDASENIVHLVLAKIRNENGKLPKGTEGLSLFIVPKFLPGGMSNDIVVAGLNHKMGYRGISNCVLNFGERGGATGWIVGKPGEGLRQMFQMMNEARINVGLGAAAVAYRSYRLAVSYAQERLQGRDPSDRSGASVPIIEHADVKQMLMTQKVHAEGSLALCLYCARLVDQSDNPRSLQLLELLTPVAKTWPSEQGLVANDLAIQIHGGYGYTRDFDVEQLLRDNRLNPIHEGTTGIQALDLLGRKIIRDDGASLKMLEIVMKQTIAKAIESTALSKRSEQLELAWDNVVLALDAVKSSSEPRRFDNATAFLRAFGHVVLAWIWLDQACSAEKIQVSNDDGFIRGKIRACHFFFEYEPPKAYALLGVVASRSDAASKASIDEL